MRVWPHKTRKGDYVAGSAVATHPPGTRQLLPALVGVPSDRARRGASRSPGQLLPWALTWMPRGVQVQTRRWYFEAIPNWQRWDVVVDGEGQMTNAAAIRHLRRSRFEPTHVVVDSGPARNPPEASVRLDRRHLFVARLNSPLLALGQSPDRSPVWPTRRIQCPTASQPAVVIRPDHDT